MKLSVYRMECGGLGFRQSRRQGTDPRVPWAARLSRRKGREVAIAGRREEPLTAEVGAEAVTRAHERLSYLRDFAKLKE